MASLKSVAQGSDLATRCWGVISRWTTEDAAASELTQREHEERVHSVSGEASELGRLERWEESRVTLWSQPKAVFL